jgi:hypothetical protein
LYRSPSAPVSDFRACLEAARNFIEQRPDHTVCLMGDFNVPEIAWNPPEANPRTANSDALLSFTEDTLLSQYIDVPSRGSSYLDLVFSNSETLVSRVRSKETRLSDHNLLEFVVTRNPCSAARETVPPQFAADEFRSLDMYKADTEAICEDLNKVNWKAVFCKCTTEELPRVFRDILFQIAQIHAPRKKPRRGRPKLVRKLSRKKRAAKGRLAQLLEKKGTPISQIEALQKRIDVLYGEIRDAILDADIKQEKLAVEKIKTNAKYFYSYAKRFAGDSSGISALTGDSASPSS